MSINEINNTLARQAFKTVVDESANNITILLGPADSANRVTDELDMLFDVQNVIINWVCPSFVMMRVYDVPVYIVKASYITNLIDTITEVG